MRPWPAGLLCAALEHEPAYPPETIDCLMQEADVDVDEAASMFEDVTGKPLAAVRWHLNSLTPLSTNTAGAVRREQHSRSN